MTRLATVLLILTAIAPFQLSAEPIVVRSGEHDAFTRLVMRVPAAVTWEITTERDLSRLSLEGFDQGFDLTNAFSIIPKNRLRALVSRGSELELQLGCNCVVRAFMERNSYLVIDISDPVPTSEETSETQTSSELPSSYFSFGELLWDADDGVRENLKKTQANAPEDDELERTAELSRLQIAKETQQRLIEGYSQAASIGLVNPKNEEVALTVPEDEAEGSVEIFDASKDFVPNERSVGDNIRVTTSKDVPKSDNPEHISLLGASCPEPSRVDITKWATEEDLSVQIARSNQALFDELGRVNAAEVLNRTRLYIHFGFGAEARQTLDLVPQLATQYPELVDLTQVMDHGFMPNPRMLHRYADCNSDYALWGMLSAEELPDDQAADVHAALQGLNRLPDNLKVFLAESLSRHLVKRGDLENAMIALRSFDRLPEVKSDVPKLIHAEVKQLDADTDGAREVLTEIVQQNGSETPQAIIQMIEQHVKDSTPVPAEIALLAETYSVELRNTPEDNEMFRAYVIGAAKSEQFTKAFQSLQGTERNPALLDELFDFSVFELSETAPDLEFLEQYYEHVATRAEDLQEITLVAVTRRLLDLGFSDAASSLGSVLFGVASTEQAKLVLAELNILNGAFEESLTILDGVRGSQAHALRARAQQNMGLFTDAVRSFQTANDSQNAISASWLSEDWVTLINDTDVMFGPAKRVSETKAEAIPVGDDMLATSAEAINSSVYIREQINQLLSNLQITE